MEEYFSLTQKYQNEYGENTILLMQVGAFFEVYGIYDKKNNIISGSKITDFSQICDLNIVDKSTCSGKQDIKMAGCKDFMIEKYIKKIQDAGFSAVVYEQDENKSKTTRSLKGVFSPGTYFQTETTVLTNNITCIWIHFIENKIILKGKYIIVGIGNIDIYTGKTSIFQFKEIYANNPTTYDELERFVSIYNPSEAILIYNLQNENEIDNIISYSGLSCKLIHKIHVNEDNSNNSNISNNSNNTNNLNDMPLKIKRVINCEKQSYQKEILSKFYKFDDYDVFIQNFYEYNIATQAFCYLLDFVYQHNPHLVNKIAEPIFENCSTRLKLANHSLKQLNIINDGTIKSSKYSCVSQMLNDCLTPMGKRKFLYYFFNPICDENELQKEYDITEYFLNKYNDFNPFFNNHLSTIKDLSKWEREIFLKKISPKSFSSLYNNILTIKTIYNKIHEDNTICEYFMKLNSSGSGCKYGSINIKNILTYCNDINDFINTHLVLEMIHDVDQIQNFEINFIQPGIDVELDAKNELLKESELKLNAIQTYLSSLIENKEKNAKKTDFVKIHETEKNNFSLLCTLRRCKLLQDILPKEDTIIKLNYDKTNPNKVYDFKISKTRFHFEKQSASNQFILDDQISQLCKNISSTKVSMKDLITKVFQHFVTKFENYQNKIETLIQFITIIDLLNTKSSIAKKYNYCKPTIVSNAEKSFVNAKNLRHCLIERFQMNELYVTNNIHLGNDVINGILLYGTNAVGKTSLIKALGISVIMAQAGLYVPCSDFEYKPYTYIFTRIIGNDNIFKGLSTFAVEMSELRTILRLSNENSLILGDELCSGTETQSAISIFVAGIQQLHQCKSSFIFATHLHEIVKYDEITELTYLSLKHMEVIYNKERDTLIYDRKLKDGPGNSMYGLEVCKSLGLPEDFLNTAYNIRMKYHPETSSILSLKPSHFNSKKIVNLCEICKINPGAEVHHLQHQSEANKDGIIVETEEGNVFHKNNIANLMTLCEKCHDEIHKKFKKGSKRVKTSKGYKILEI